MEIDFDELEEVFSPPNFEVRKGSQVFLLVYLDGNLKDFDNSIWGTEQILRSWGYISDGKEIRPFTLLNYTGYENWFKAELKFEKKDNKNDELKFQIQDLIDIYNIEGIRVKKCEIKKTL
jgi:hypothetical protein